MSSHQQQSEKYMFSISECPFSSGKETLFDLDTVSVWIYSICSAMFKNLEGQCICAMKWTLVPMTSLDFVVNCSSFVVLVIFSVISVVFCGFLKRCLITVIYFVFISCIV